MRKVINRKVYDTETAEAICESIFSNRRDFHYCWETLYRTKKGAFFLYGEGGQLSGYSKTVGQNEWSGGENIRLLTVEEAMAFVEENGTCELYEECFGSLEEG